MVDFSKLAASRSQPTPTDPLKIFQRLPKPPHINDLWESQSDALRAWEKRRNENDLVIKLNTGGGKTLVGLLICQALLNELGKPVMYLCPNNQLVRQTIDKAAEVGLPSVPYARGPGLLSAEFLNASAILVANYNVLFNGRSKFGVLGSGSEYVEIGGLVCDDAHTALSAVRDAFSISITRSEQPELYISIVMQFRVDFEAIRKIGSFDDIVERQGPEVLEIPYPAWASKADSIRQILARNHAAEFKWQLPLLRDNFDSCHALISSRDVYITPIQPLVHLIPSFENCRRRIYMSATIADDSSIIRTFDANSKSVSSPIVPDTLAGVGERMILAPSLTEIDEADQFSAACTLALQVARRAGVVVLIPSERAAKRWEDIATLRMGGDIDQVIVELQSGTTHGPYAFANRYDGIDLIGDACRLLVIDGLPKGANSYELFRAEVLQASSSLNVSLAQKVEQGMGRATRGAGDYCVVLLIGADLVSWITRSDSLRLMTPSTRTQVIIGHEISKTITKEEEIWDAVRQCLERDPAWTKYHAETLADRAESPSLDLSAIEAASVEREYARAFILRQFDAAAQTATNFASKHFTDKRLRGWFLQLAARGLHYAQDYSSADSLQKQAAAANPMLWAPPGMRDVYVPRAFVGNQAENIVTQIAKFEWSNGHLQDFEFAISSLTPAASSNVIEEGLKRLGLFLGFCSERPEQENGLGPDVLWLPDSDFGILIESKAKKDPKNPLTKAEHGQLLVSAEWFRQQYPDRQCVRVQFHPNEMATEPAMARDTLAFTFEGLVKLIAALRLVLKTVCQAAVTKEERLRLCEKQLAEQNLTPPLLVEHYFSKFMAASSGR